MAGNILARYHTKSIQKITGVLDELPKSGILWIAGFFAITGTPPFGLFQSELAIIRAAFDSGHIMVAVILLVALGIIFVGMASIVLGMAYGPTSATDRPAVPRESFYSVIPPAILCVGVLVLGIYIPPALNKLLAAATQLLGGQ